MRNLTYPETALSLIVIAMAAGLVYFAWLAPAISQTRSDRRTTQALLFRLASTERKPADDVPAASATTRPAEALRPAIRAPTKLPKPSQRRAEERARSRELELGDSDDPLEGIGDAR